MTTTLTALATLIEDIKAAGLGTGPVGINISIMCGLSGTTLVPVKVDAAGRSVSLLSDEVEV